MRDRFTVLIGLITVALGVAWLADLGFDLSIPWQWVLPITVIVIGLVLVFARSGGDGGAPRSPSQFERDDTPRVP